MMMPIITFPLFSSQVKFPFLFCFLNHTSKYILLKNDDNCLSQLRHQIAGQDNGNKTPFVQAKLFLMIPCINNGHQRRRVQQGPVLRALSKGQVEQNMMLKCAECCWLSALRWWSCGPKWLGWKPEGYPGNNKTCLHFALGPDLLFR